MTESGHYCHTPQIRVLKAVACMTRSLLMPGPDEAMDLKPLGGGVWGHAWEIWEFVATEMPSGAI